MYKYVCMRILLQGKGGIGMAQGVCRDLRNYKHGMWDPGVTIVALPGSGKY